MTLDEWFRGKGSGVEVTQTETHVWRMRDGKAISGWAFAERDEALSLVQRA